MKRMTTIAVLAGLLLALPLTAHAQSMDEAWRAWGAAVQMGTPFGDEGIWGEVCWRCDDQSPDVIKHALSVMRRHGLEAAAPGNISTDPEERTEGEGCYYYYDAEAGEWRERCSDYRTYRCYTHYQIDYMREVQDGARQAGFFYGGAAIFAGSIGAQRPYGIVFAAISFGFNWHAYNVGKQIERMEAAKCNP